MRKLTEQDMTAIVGTVHSGYTIERARVKGGSFSDSDHYGIVLDKNGIGNYVTWQYHLDDDAPNLYWGHYHLENRDAAVEDYETRE